jgi:plastocyanin
MSNKIQKTAYVFSVLALIAVAFFGFSNTASADYYDNTDWSYDSGYYGDYYDNNDWAYNDGYYGYGNSGDYYDNYQDYDYGYSDYCDNCDYGYDYSDYSDNCGNCNSGYNDYSYGYDYPQYASCGSGCSSGGGSTDTIIDIYNNNTNTNTNTNIVYGSSNNNNDDDYDDLDVSCDVSDSSVETGDNVTWSANASGGNGNYSYSWSGSSPLNGRTGRTVTVDYSSEGSKSGSVRVTSNGQSATANCGSVDVEDDNNNNNNNDDDFSVSCKADDRTVRVGDRVRWIAEVDGVDEDDVDFSWSGDADGDDEEITERYNKKGTYEAKIRARFDGQTETDTCTVRVEDNNDDGNVTLVSNPPTGTLASLNSVYLSQVPYTGASDKAKILGFITMLALSSLAGAYYIVTRKARRDRKSFITHFKQENLALNK